MLAKDSFKKLTDHIGYFRGKTNVGLVISGSTLFLIDSGNCQEDGEVIAASLKELFPDKKLKAVINTHGHSDHCAGNFVLKNATGCEIWAPKTESVFIENPNIIFDIYWGGRHFHPKDGSAFNPPTACKVDRRLGAGRAESKTVLLQTVFLPGHFYDQLGIIATDKASGKKVYFMGDAFFGIDMIKKYWIPFMQDEVLFRQSINKIEDENADFFVPSHGAVFGKDKVHALAEMNIMMTLETERLIIKILQKKPSTSEEILKAVADYAELNMKLGQYVLIGTTIRAYLSCLYNSNYINYKVENNTLLWSVAG